MRHAKCFSEFAYFRKLLTIVQIMSYMSTIIYVIFKVLLIRGKQQNDEELEYFRKDIQPFIPKFDQMSHSSKEIVWANILDNFYLLTKYRYYEVTVFFSQILAIVVYIVFCKLFKSLKKCLGTFDKTEPFHKYLVIKNEDFLETENLF